MKYLKRTHFGVARLRFQSKSMDYSSGLIADAQGEPTGNAGLKRTHFGGVARLRFQSKSMDHIDGPIVNAQGEPVQTTSRAKSRGTVWFIVESCPPTT